MVLTKPGAAKTYTEFESDLYVLKEDEGRRAHKAWWGSCRLRWQKEPFP